MDKRIYIRVPEQLLEEFDRACKANYTTKSEVLRRAMLEYVRETKKEVIE
jgi:metal-responsive CopG/Arc/MetJ family transcriptional regulator